MGGEVKEVGGAGGSKREALDNSVLWVVLFLLLFISHCHIFFSFFFFFCLLGPSHVSFFFCSSIKCYGTANEPCGSMSRYDIGG